MNLQRAMQLTVAAQLTLGTLLLGIGQGSILLPALAIVAAGGSLWLTDITGAVRLKQKVATLAALCAVAIFAADLYRMGTEQQLLAIANLLVYLQVVLLFQRKDLRIYWQLLMLSLLQVVVAAALSLSLWFGPLLLAYLFLGLLSLSLFFAVRESLPFQTTTSAGDSSDLGFESSEQRQSTLRAEGFLPVAREDLNSTRIGRDLAQHVTWQALFTLLLATALFFIVPRFQKAPLITTTLAAQTVIGYNETVELGKLGVALQDPASVMRVWFSDPGTGLPYSVAEEPLFRGAVVETYENKNWRPHVASEVGDPSDLERPPLRTSYITQRIALEEQKENTVFSILPAYRLDAESKVEYDPRRQQLIRKTRRGRLEFALATTGLSEGRQVDITPAWQVPDSEAKARLLQLPGKDSGNDLLPGLKQHAAKAVASVPKQHFQQAKALEASLGPASGFEYSLAPPPRNLSLDPVEDFVTANRKGHCEYFATALTLMLRSQGIPARMVIGFKGGEFNSLGAYYQVRMLHAHTWVEAYLEPDQLPADFTPRRRGGWLKLDPTPGSDESAEKQDLSLAEKARDWMDYGDYLWMNYIVGLDSRRQQESVYTALAPVGRAIRGLFTREMWTQTIPNLVRSLFERETWRELGSSMLSWPALAAGAMLALVGYLAWRMRRRFASWFRRLARWRPRAAGAAHRAARVTPVVPFYEQLETLLAQHGIRRPESQTQHEFAMAVGGQLSESPRLATAATLPRKVVDAFYRVRFGQRALDKAETEAVERSLRELAAALAG